MVATGEVAAASTSASPPRAPDGRRRRWNEHRTQRRAALVAAGIAAIDEHGPDASADQIAAIAGVSRTVLYRYFRDKDDLQQAISQQMVEVVVASRVIPLHAGGTANQIIRGTVTVVVDWLDGHPNLYEFLRSRGRLGGGLEAVEVTMADQVAGVLQSFMMAFGLDLDVAEPGAHGIVGLVESTSTWWLKHRPTPREDFIDYLSATVWYVVEGSLRARGFALDPDLALPPDASAQPPTRAPAHKVEQA
jgi:AcrR family transcriptional regulator